MSATRDKNQKVAFVYSNIYQIYRDSKAAVPAEQTEATPARPAVSSPSSHVIKSEIIKTNQTGLKAAHKIEDYKPQEFIAKRIVSRPAVLSSVVNSGASNPVVESLKENLKSLNDLHSKLHFMLQELEELIQD